MLFQIDLLESQIHHPSHDPIFQAFFFSFLLSFSFSLNDSPVLWEESHLQFQ